MKPGGIAVGEGSEGRREADHAWAESVASKAPFRELIPRAERRALQVADGYCECEALPASRLSARPVSPVVNKPDPESEGPPLLAAL